MCVGESSNNKILERPRVIDRGNNTGLVLEFAENRTWEIRRIKNVRPLFTGTGTDQIQAQGFDGGGSGCLDQLKWTDDSVRTFHGRPSGGIGHIKHLADQVERTGGKTLLQLQGMGVL
ncbi:hypothetical protein D3C84_694910 [compost metagenome]